jgi:hypothetical protein
MAGTAIKNAFFGSCSGRFAYHHSPKISATTIATVVAAPPPTLATQSLCLEGMPAIAGKLATSYECSNVFLRVRMENHGQDSQELG